MNVVEFLLSISVLFLWWRVSNLEDETFKLKRDLYETGKRLWEMEWNQDED